MPTGNVTRDELANSLGSVSYGGDDWDEYILNVADALLAKYVVLSKVEQPCTCGWGGQHDSDNPKCDRNGYHGSDQPNLDPSRVVRAFATLPLHDPAPEKPKLDPAPWVFTFSGNRYRYRDPLLDPTRWLFDPRPGYSTDPTHYPQEGTR